MLKVDDERLASDIVFGRRSPVVVSPFGRHRIGVFNGEDSERHDKPYLGVKLYTQIYTQNDGSSPVAMVNGEPAKAM
jgi:hypothetical protein